MMENVQVGLRHRDETQAHAFPHEQDQQQKQEGRSQNRQRNDVEQVDKENRNRNRCAPSSHKWNSNSSTPFNSTPSPSITAAAYPTTGMILEITPLDHDGDTGKEGSDENSMADYDSARLSPRSVAAHGHDKYYHGWQKQQRQKQRPTSHASAPSSSSKSTSKSPLSLLLQQTLILASTEIQDDRDDNNYHSQRHQQPSAGRKKIEKAVTFSIHGNNAACIERSENQDPKQKDHRKAVSSSINQKQIEYYRRVLKHDIYKYTVMGYRENDGTGTMKNNNGANSSNVSDDEKEFSTSDSSNPSDSSFTTLGLMDKISGSSRRTARIALREAAWSSVLWEVYNQKRHRKRNNRHRYNPNHTQQRLDDDAVAAVYYDSSMKATIIAREEAMQLQKQLYGSRSSDDEGEEAIKSYLTSRHPQAAFGMLSASSVASGRIRTAVI